MESGSSAESVVRGITCLVECYGHHRCHESLNNLTPAAGRCLVRESEGDRNEAGENQTADFRAAQKVQSVTHVLNNHQPGYAKTSLLTSCPTRPK